MAEPQRKKIAFVMTWPGTLRHHMCDHITALSDRYDITVFLNLSTDTCEDLVPARVTLVHVPFERKVKPATDLHCLALLMGHLRRGRFHSVHSVMPKTGLLAMLAAFSVRAPVRVHMFTGQVWVLKRGFKRHALKGMDRLVVALATHILVDSPSQRDFLRDEGILKDGEVLGFGSIRGVDVDRFRPMPDESAALRAQSGIPDDALIFGFLGRLNRDKGVLDLVDGFAQADLPAQARLMLVGSDEDNIVSAVHAKFGDLRGRLLLVGYTKQPELYVNVFDVFCNPSYREGFGTAAIEAAACGVPAVASRIYGVTDAVEEGVTGLLHAAGNAREIAAALERMAKDTPMRVRMGEAARKRAREKFSNAFVVSKMVAFYERNVG